MRGGGREWGCGVNSTCQQIVPNQGVRNTPLLPVPNQQVCFHVNPRTELVIHG